MGGVCGSGAADGELRVGSGVGAAEVAGVVLGDRTASLLGDTLAGGFRTTGGRGLGVTGGRDGCSEVGFVVGCSVGSCVGGVNGGGAVGRVGGARVGIATGGLCWVGGALDGGALDGGALSDGALGGEVLGDGALDGGVLRGGVGDACEGLLDGAGEALGERLGLGEWAGSLGSGLPAQVRSSWHRGTPVSAAAGPTANRATQSKATAPPAATRSHRPSFPLICPPKGSPVARILSKTLACLHKVLPP